MKNNNNKMLFSTTTLLGALLFALPTAVQAETKLYIGGNIGVSTLEPRIVGTGSVDENSDTAFKLYAGYDLGTKQHFSVEAFYADMGAAQIKTPSVQGDVAYTLFGVGLVYNKPFNDKFSGLGKIGFADVKNDAKSNISVTKINDSVMYVGAGLEYALTKKLSARIEYEYYDEDVQLLSAGLRWDF